MKKYGYILLVFSVVLFVTGLLLMIFNQSNNPGPSTSSEEKFDENYIDRSLEEKQIRESTGNPYYTINTSLKLSEDRDYEGLKITNSRLIRSDKYWYSFTCFLTNTLETEYPLSTFDVEFVNKEGKVIFKEEAFVSSIASGATTTLFVTTKNNILDAYDFNIVRTGDYIPAPKEYHETQE